MKRAASALLIFFWTSLSALGYASTRAQLSSERVGLESLSRMASSVGELQGPSRRIEILVDSDVCALYGTGLESYFYLTIGDLKSTGRPGEPELPMKVIKLTLDGLYDVTGVRLSSANFARFEQALRIAPVAQIVEWRIGGGRPDLIPDPAVYGSNCYFPGKLVSYDWGCDNKKTYVYVRIFPVQYRPLSGEAVLLTEASVDVYYHRKESGPRFAPVSPFDDRCVVICPAEFLAAAETLEAFHEMEEGITTYIATNEWIDTNYSCVTDTPPWFGYAHEQPLSIQNYDYDLAKKIIAFMRDTLAHPNLEYITLLGDGGRVPPSYYCKFQAASESETWVPTDMLYASCDFDYVPNYCCGRISVSDTLEAMHVVTKIRDWHASADWSWFGNATVTGGIPFGTPQYIGELITCDVVNRDAFNGHNVIKLYETDGNFTESVCDDYLRGEQECGIFFQISHGSGPAVYYDDGSNIDAGELVSYAAHTNVPVVASVACDCGAFDTDLVPGLGFATSFGEGILKSPAAGIAYYGGSRSNAGSPSWYIDDGNLVITRDWYMSELLTYVWDAYHNGAGTLGEIHQAAFDSFLANNDMSAFQTNRVTYFEAILLGDPALVVPAQVGGNSYGLPYLNAQTPQYLNARDYPVYHNSQNDSVSIISTSGSPGAVTKLMDAFALSGALDSRSYSSPPFEYKFPPGTGPSFYLVRTMVDDSKEGWLYLYNGVMIAVDGDSLDWHRAAIDPAGVDSNDFEPEDLEITDLYVANDGEYWYFGFPSFNDTMWHATYGIALDYAPGGYDGVQGSDRDGPGNWITFDSSHAVDAEIYVFPAFDFSMVFFWQGSAWSSYDLTDLGGVMTFDGDSAHFLELAFPNSMIGDPECINANLFSSGMGDFAWDPQPAQDASPSDPATYHTPHWGQTWANTLTQFTRVCKTGLQERPDHAAGERLWVHLREPSPNPFRGSCSIRFTIPEKGLVKLGIYNSAGQLVDAPVGAVMNRGVHTHTWDGTDARGNKLPGGVYFGRLDFGGISRVTKLIKLE
jgi:hypothetical protein